LKLNEDFPEANRGYAKLLFYIGRYAEAERYIQRALEIRKDYADAHADCGFLLGNLKNVSNRTCRLSCYMRGGGLDSSLSEVLQMKRKHEDELLLRRLALGCSVGCKVARGKTTNELCVVVYVYPKQNEPAEELIPPDIDGVKTDIQESKPLGDYAACASYVSPTSDSLICSRLECMNEQKQVILNQGIVNKVDYAYIRSVSREDIIRVAEKTGLFLEQLRHQLEFDRRFGEPFRGQGGSMGHYNFSIDRIYPGAGKFMQKLKKHVDSKPAERSRIPSDAKRQGGPVLVPTEVAGLGRSTGRMVDPRLGMKVRMSGATSEVTEGTIVGIDASLFIDYPPWMGEGGLTPPLEPVFSPMIGEIGARFPLDVLGFVEGGIPIRFPPEPKNCSIAKSHRVRHRRRALFTGQIVTTKMASKGDSGAPLYDAEMNVVGMLFAGSESFTFFHPMKTVRTEADRLLESRQGTRKRNSARSLESPYRN
jgi:tetratricopeptide (TPR) repeat protein